MARYKSLFSAVPYRKTKSIDVVNLASICTWPPFSTLSVLLRPPSFSKFLVPVRTNSSWQSHPCDLLDEHQLDWSFGLVVFTEVLEQAVVLFSSSGLVKKTCLA